MQLETARLIIRPMRETDAEAIFLYASDSRVTEPAGWKAHSCIQQTEAYVRSCLDDEKAAKHVITLRGTGEVIGQLSIDADSEEGRPDTRELGFMIRRDWQNKGYMTEAVNAVVDELFSEGIRYVWACCFKGNAASKRVIEKCGFAFQQEGEYESHSLGKTFESLEYRISRK